MGVGGGGVGLGVMLRWFLLPLAIEGDVGWETTDTEISTLDAAPRHPNISSPRHSGLGILQLCRLCDNLGSQLLPARSCAGGTLDRRERSGGEKEGRGASCSSTCARSHSQAGLG